MGVDHDQAVLTHGLTDVAEDGVAVLRRTCELLRHPAVRMKDADRSEVVDDLLAGLESLASELARCAIHPVRDEVPDVELRLLGPVQLRVDGAVRGRWRSKTGRAVLARLALAGEQGVSVEELLADVWPDAPFDGGRNRVHVAVHKLRQVLGDSESAIITSDGYRYRLAGPDVVRVDVRELLGALREGKRLAGLGHASGAIEALLAAVGDGTGSLCEGEPATDWLDRERELVAWRIRDGLHLLGELALEHGDVAMAVRAAERAVSVDAADEVAHRLLIRCHRIRGRDDLAREQFRRCAEAMERELGLDPLPETMAILDEDLSRWQRAS